MNIEVQTVLVFPVSGNKCIFRVVQVTEETLMVGEAGTQDRTDDWSSDVCSSDLHWCYPERRLNTFFAVSEILTDLVSHDFTDPLDVTTEAHTVFLYIDVAQFCNKPV